MRTICWPIVAAALLGSTPGPAIAQGILSKARYAHPAIAALPPAVGSGQSLAAVAPVAQGASSASPVVTGDAAGVTCATATGLTVDGVAVDGVAVSGVAVSGADGLAAGAMPGAPGDVGIDPGGVVIMPCMPPGVPGGGVPDGFDGDISRLPLPIDPGSVPGAVGASAGGLVIVTGQPTPAALLRAANAAAAASPQSASGGPAGLAQQIRDQVRHATGGQGFRPGGGRTIGAGTRAFGIPADAKPLNVAATAPGGGPRPGRPRHRPGCTRPRVWPGPGQPSPPPPPRGGVTGSVSPCRSAADHRPRHRPPVMPPASIPASRAVVA
ncbi:MAG: hypothetical protein EBR86_14530 [Planctomycetia bacterium]|nr:hypothetical protein [Planctomycetia bacterium]